MCKSAQKGFSLSDRMDRANFILFPAPGQDVRDPVLFRDAPLAPSNTQGCQFPNDLESCSWSDQNDDSLAFSTGKGFLIGPVPLGDDDAGKAY